MAWLDENTAGERKPRPPGDSDLLAALAHLRAHDPVMADLIDKHGPCRLSPSTPYFPVVVETVISQQLSTHAAKAIYRRLVGLVGRKSPRPSDILAIPDRRFLDIGFSRSKTQYVKNAANLFGSRRLGPRTFARMSDAEVTELLTSVKGIGDWSAHMFLIFALGRLDVFPVGDLGLRNAMARAYRLRKPPAPARLERIGNRWRPYRTVGTLYMWASYDNG
jgi:DNA-3-methyladenine glycosylase II